MRTCRVAGSPVVNPSWFESKLFGMVVMGTTAAPIHSTSNVPGQDVASQKLIIEPIDRTGKNSTYRPDRIS